MTTYFHEIPESRELGFDPPVATHHWVCEGIFDDYEMGQLALSGTPTTWLHPAGVTLYRTEIKVRETGHRLYEVIVDYERTNKEIGSYRIETDTLGGTVHVKGGSHIASYPSGSPTHDGLIGVKGDDVEGVDIVIPATRRIVHFSHPGGYMSESQIAALEDIVGTVDNSGFMGRQPYETLFLGFQYQQSATFGTMESELREEVSYHFAVSKNVTNLEIAGISGISKRGWDVAWAKWREAVENSAASNEAEYVNVVRVYRDEDFRSVLGFG